MVRSLPALGADLVRIQQAALGRGERRPCRLHLRRWKATLQQDGGTWIPNALVLFSWVTRGRSKGNQVPGTAHSRRFGRVCYQWWIQDRWRWCLDPYQPHRRRIMDQMGRSVEAIACSRYWHGLGAIRPARLRPRSLSLRRGSIYLLNPLPARLLSPVLYVWWGWKFGSTKCQSRASEVEISHEQARETWLMGSES